MFLHFFNSLFFFFSFFTQYIVAPRSLIGVVSVDKLPSLVHSTATDTSYGTCDAALVFCVASCEHLVRTVAPHGWTHANEISWS